MLVLRRSLVHLAQSLVGETQIAVGDEAARHVGDGEVLDEVVAASLAAFCNIEEAFYGELPEAGEPGFHQRCPEQQDQLWSQYLRTFLAFRAAYGYEARAGVNFDWFLRLRTDTLFLLPIPSHGTFQAGITVAIENDAHMSDQAPPARVSAGQIA